MIDYTRLLNRLDPKPDGESPVRHRTAVVDAVNSDGTVDIILSGLIVPDVSVVESVRLLEVDDVVQVVSWGGDLLVLGRVRTSDDVGIADLVAFDSLVNNGNQALSTAFQAAITLTFTPPTDWGTYKIQAQVSASVGSVNSGDSIQLICRVIPGVGNGPLTDDNAASTYRYVIAHNEGTGLTGAIDIIANIRNNTASRGLAFTSWAQIVAVRET